MSKLIELAEETWLPGWFESFSNPEGGFYERLDDQNQPIDMPRRLLTQCRQIIVYSFALAENPKLTHFSEKLDETFLFLKQVYFRPDRGGSIFSIGSNNEAEDTTYDLYGHTFILLACAAYYKATQNTDALVHAKTTFNFIMEKFSLNGRPGLAEALDNHLKSIPAIRRQNPHMHLMEACLYMYEASEDEAYLSGANEMLTLFFDHFFDTKTQTLGEFFDDNLKPHPTEGHLVEAGHHAEWVWLLKRYQEISGSQDPRIDETMHALFNWVKTHGIDHDKGGIFNVQDRAGKIIDSNKRIWPNFEVLRAASIMMHSNQYVEEATMIVSELIETLMEHYIDKNTGNWLESADISMKPHLSYRPGTTPYHIYPVLRDAALYSK